MPKRFHQLPQVVAVFGVKAHQGEVGLVVFEAQLCPKGIVFNKSHAVDSTRDGHFRNIASSIHGLLESFHRLIAPCMIEMLSMALRVSSCRTIA